MWELILEALTTLRTNMMRTVLTMIGIILGVGAVVTIMTIGQSAFDTAEEEIMGSGSNITISANNSTGINKIPLDKSFINVLKAANITGIANYEPHCSGISGTATNALDDKVDAVMRYVNLNDVKDLKIIAGYTFDEEDMNNYGAVAIIDQFMVNKLFTSPGDALEENVHLNGKVFKVVGVVENEANFSSDYGHIYVPLSFCELDPFFQTYGYNYLSLGAEIGSDYETITKEIKKVLMETYGFEDEDELTFTIENVNEIMVEIGTFMTAFSIGLSLIAAISLLVGGVGIMNIMLVNVTERTKEIGLMKALGAQDKDITFQFLVEAAVMTICGGALGVFLGIGVSWLIIVLANTFGGNFLPEFKFVISQTSIIVSVIVSTAIGLIFGAYPAKKAAKLDPVEALRRD